MLKFTLKATFKSTGKTIVRECYERAIPDDKETMDEAHESG